MRAGVAGVFAFALAACAGGGSSAASRAARNLPSGTAMALAATVEISSHANKVGDPVTARVSSAVLSARGDTVIPVGSALSGTVTQLSRSTSANAPGHLQLAFNEVRVGATSYPIQLHVTSIATHLATPGVTVEDAAKVAVGAAAGAIAGRVIGGDRTGARVGAGAGAAAGVIYANRSRDRDIIMSSGAAIQAMVVEGFRLKS